MNSTRKLISGTDLTSIGVVLSTTCLGLVEVARISFCLYLGFYSATLAWSGSRWLYSRCLDRRSRTAQVADPLPALRTRLTPI